jgi:hypothetical protein
MRELKKDPSIKRTRLLDPRNPGSGRKDFYHTQIYEALAKHYRPATALDANDAIQERDAN